MDVPLADRFPRCVYDGPGFREEGLRLPVGAGFLAAHLIVPACPPRAVLLCCPPIGEEMKFSYRPLVGCLRALAADGFASLRFQYRGSGESDGREEDLTFASMAEDARRAREFVGEVLPGAGVTWLGLRLGANLAAVLAAQTPGDRALALEPLDSARKHIEDLYRKRMLQSWLAGRKEERKNLTDAFRDASTVDLGEMVIGRPFYEELPGIDQRWEGFREDAPKERGRLRIARLAARRGARLARPRANAILPSENESALFAGRPYWVRGGLRDPAPLAAFVRGLLSEP